VLNCIKVSVSKKKKMGGNLKGTASKLGTNSIMMGEVTSQKLTEGSRRANGRGGKKVGQTGCKVRVGWVGKETFETKGQGKKGQCRLMGACRQTGTCFWGWLESLLNGGETKNGTNTLTCAGGGYWEYG